METNFKVFIEAKKMNKMMRFKMAD